MYHVDYGRIVVKTNSTDDKKINRNKYIFAPQILCHIYYICHLVHDFNHCKVNCSVTKARIASVSSRSTLAKPFRMDATSELGVASTKVFESGNTCRDCTMSNSSP